MIIITDSAADFTPEELAAHDIRCVSTEVILGGQSYIARQNLSDEEFWQRLLAGEDAKTSQPSPAAFLAEFEAVRAAGKEAVCICISSALSGTLQSAKIAASMIDYDKIHIVDSFCGAAAQKLLVLTACRLRDEGRHIASEVTAHLEALRSRVRLVASLDTLDNLARSGRIPKAVASLGAVAKLKPIVEVTPDGRIALCGKAFGRHRAMDFLTKRIAAMKIDRSHPIIPIYSYCTDNCLALIRRLADAGITVSEELLCAVGPSIAPHIGPGVYGLAFFEAGEA